MLSTISSVFVGITAESIIKIHGRSSASSLWVKTFKEKYQILKRTEFKSHFRWSSNDHEYPVILVAIGSETREIFLKYILKFILLPLLAQDIATQ